MQTIALHPENSRYFLFRGRPTVIVTSGEHYGAVLNTRFDYIRYLDALAADGLNGSRVFAGPYRELSGSFSIANNTMAPEREHLLLPWPRSSQPGAADGGCLFDLSRFEDRFYHRLRSFAQAASDRGIILEVTLFCPYYPFLPALWMASPLNAANNIQKLCGSDAMLAYSLQNTEALAVQLAMVDKTVEVLAGFDNIVYEIMNEPWASSVALEWQHAIAERIVQAEALLGVKHLISRNVCNGWSRAEFHPCVDVYEYHYASPPHAVEANRELCRPVGCNETGFGGQDPETYLRQAWAFLLSGGALFNNLDYSFIAGYEDGTHVPDADTPGWGSPDFRRRLGILKKFMDGLPFVEMRPDKTLIRCCHSLHADGWCLAGAGIFALWFQGSYEYLLELDVPQGIYEARWLDTDTGEEEAERVYSDGVLRLEKFKKCNQIALTLKKLEV